jgi:hypothetical protein
MIPSCLWIKEGGRKNCSDSKISGLSAMGDLILDSGCREIFDS